MAGAIRINGCLNSGAAMRAVAANEFDGIILRGEPEFIGSAGEGDPIDLVLSYYGYDVTQTKSDMWEYYKSAVSAADDTSLKAWLHWNGKAFDAYLKCEQDIAGDSGFASHDMPYVQ